MPLPRRDLLAGSLLALAPAREPVASASLPTEAGLRQDLARDSGSGLIGFFRGSPGSIARTAQDKLGEVVSVKDFGAVGDGATDDRPAIQAAIDASIETGGELVFPSGNYLIGAIASGDEMRNGLALPFQGDFDTKPRLVLRGIGRARLLCGGNNMILVRISDTFVGLDNLVLAPNGHTGCWARAVVPEDMAQTRFQVSQSYYSEANITVESVPGNQFDEGLVFQAGPSPEPNRDSGCFYHSIYAARHNTVKRDIWCRPTPDLSNSCFITRTAIDSCSFVNGNVGATLHGVGDISFINTNIELKNVTGPSATPAAIQVVSNAPNTFGQFVDIVNCHFESNTASILNSSANAQVKVIGGTMPAPSGAYADNVAFYATDRTKLYGGNVGATVETRISQDAEVVVRIDPVGAKATRSWAIELFGVTVFKVGPYLKADPSGISDNAWHEIGHSNPGAPILSQTHGDAVSPRGTQIIFSNYAANPTRANFLAHYYQDKTGRKSELWDNGEYRVASRLRPGTPDGALQTVTGMFAGNGPPNNAHGANGDFYFRGDGTVGGNTAMYHKEGGSWVAFTTR